MNNFGELYNKYISVKKMGWIKLVRLDPGGIGCKFEELIGKTIENFPIPDYDDIEVKTISDSSYENVTLFSLTPDGDYLYPIKRVLDKLGYPAKGFPQYKALNIKVNAKEYSNLGYYKKVKLNVNYKKQTIELKAIRINGQEIPVNISWSFKIIEDRLLLKMKNLAIINVATKVNNDKKYAYYYNISLYKLKNFEKFIDLIEKGIIIVHFNISVYKSGTRIGKIHDRGTGFTIEKKNIGLLFDKVEFNSK